MTEAKWSLPNGMVAPTKDELFPPDLYPIENKLYSKQRGQEAESVKVRVSDFAIHFRQ